MNNDRLHELDLASWASSAPRGQKSFREAVHIVLAAVSSSATLRTRMIIKGGILMAIRYNSSRYTRDADFSTRDTYLASDKETLLGELTDQIDLMNNHLPYDTMCRLQTHKLVPPREDASFPTLELTIGYAQRSKRGEMQRLLAGQAPNVVKIDHSYNEAVYDIEILSLSDGAELHAYSLNNLIAEKFRSLLQQPSRRRNRRQDVYDLHRLLTSVRPLSQQERSDILKLLVNSSEARHIAATADSMANVQVRSMAEEDYLSLAAEIDEDLPDFDSSYRLVQVFYESLPW